MLESGKAKSINDIALREKTPLNLTILASPLVEEVLDDALPTQYA